MTKDCKRTVSGDQDSVDDNVDDNCIANNNNKSTTNKSSKLVGVIGGMGPEATIDFMGKVVKYTVEKYAAENTVDYENDVVTQVKDQDHVRMLIHHDPTIPSRQQAAVARLAADNCSPDSDKDDDDDEGQDGERAITAGATATAIGTASPSSSPGVAMAALASSLENAGVDFIVMPCNLAHFWQDDVCRALNGRIPFVSMIHVTVKAAVHAAIQYDNAVIGIMTTPGCFHAGLYQAALDKKVQGGRPCPYIVQTQDELEETMEYVHRIKRGETSNPAVVQGLTALANKLVARGAQVIIGACTEFPLVLEEFMLNNNARFISSTDELAKHTVALALLE